MTSGPEMEPTLSLQLQSPYWTKSIADQCQTLTEIIYFHQKTTKKDISRPRSIIKLTEKYSLLYSKKLTIFSVNTEM